LPYKENLKEFTIAAHPNKDCLVHCRLGVVQTPNGRPQVADGFILLAEKKNIHRRSSIFDVYLLVCLPRAPNTGATNENPPRVLPPTPSTGARPVRASDTSTWRSASGQRLCGSSTPPHPIPFHGTPVQLWHRVESAGRRSLVHWPVTRSPRSATATIIADTLPKEKGASRRRSRREA
jgi:hypothetical protein